MGSFVCWVSSNSQENYDICKETSQWGIGRNSGVANSHVQKVKKGDKLYIWVGGKGYVGLAESAVDNPIPITDSDKVPWEGDYSYLLPWNFIKELENPIYLRFMRDEGQIQELTGISQGITISGFFEINENQASELDKLFSSSEVNKLLAPDSYVYPQNKKGNGAGESTPYIGNQNNETFNYWGNLGEFIDVEASKKNLLEYYFTAKDEFLSPSQDYRDTNKMKSSFLDLYDDIKSYDESIFLNYQIYSGEEDKSRVYLKTVDENSKKINNIFRKLSIHPFTTLKFIKVKEHTFTLDLIFNKTVLKNETIENKDDINKEVNELPKTTERMVFTYVTNPELIKQIKSKYTKCQFCNYVFENYIDSNNEIKQYSEAAHIKPKSEGGLDKLNNILCLCANCHSLFDLGTLYIDDNFVVRKSKKLLNVSRYEDSYFNELQLNDDHELELSNIKFHRKLTKNN